MTQRAVNRTPAYLPDKTSHIHHLLLKRYGSQPKAVWAIYGLTAVLCALALVLFRVTGRVKRYDHPNSSVRLRKPDPTRSKWAPVVLELKRRPEFAVRVAVTGQHREMLDQVLSVFRHRP